MFTNITKTLIAALVVTSGLVVASAASAAPKAYTPSEQSYFNRASQNVDGGGN